MVFADLGTSVYYVPAILYAQVGGLAPVFVLVAAIAFVFVALGHLEIAHRYPKGGGGVAAASEAFGPRVGVISGALMVSAYLLTITISVVTALHYIAAIRPFAHEIPVLSVVALLLLGSLHWVGVRELPRVALAMGDRRAGVARGCWSAVVLAQVPKLHWIGVLDQLQGTWRPQQLDRDGDRVRRRLAGVLGAGVAGAARARAARAAPARACASSRCWSSSAWWSPCRCSRSSPVEAAQASGIGPQPALLAAVALAYGGRPLLVALSLTGAGFLLVGANVAFIGCYNVFKAVGELGYLPAAMAARHKRFGTPRVAIVVITAATVLLVITTRRRAVPRWARCSRSACSGRTRSRRSACWRSRWREKRRGLPMIIDGRRQLGAGDPVGHQLVHQAASRRSTASPVTGLQLAVAFVTHRGWIRSGRFGYLRAASAERAAAAGPATNEVVTLEEAVALRGTYPSTTLVALRGPNQNLCREAARRARGAGDAAVYVIFVDEIPGLFFPPRTGPVRRGAGGARGGGRRHRARGDGGGADLAPGAQRRARRSPRRPRSCRRAAC